MPLDPQAQALLEQMKQMGFIFTPDLTPARGREMMAQFLAIRPPGEAVVRVEDRLIPGPAGEIPIRIYTHTGMALYRSWYFYTRVPGCLATLTIRNRCAVASRIGLDVLSFR